VWTLYVVGALLCFLFLWWVSRDRRRRPRVRFTVLGFFPYVETGDDRPSKPKWSVVGVVTTADGGLRLHQIDADTADVQKHLAVKLGHHIGRTFEIVGLLAVDQRDPTAAPVDRLTTPEIARRKCHTECCDKLASLQRVVRSPDDTKESADELRRFSKHIQTLSEAMCWYDRLRQVVYHEKKSIPEPVWELLVAYHGLPESEPSDSEWTRWKAGELGNNSSGFLHFHGGQVDVAGAEHTPNFSSLTCSCTWRLPSEISK